MEKRRLPTEDFISRSIQVHGNRYDYFNVEYVNSSTEVEIGCSVHGKFYQQPQYHMNGSGCPKCSVIEQHEKQKKSINDFISDSIKIHGDLYDYSMVEYIDSKTPIIVVCNIHGEFYPTPNNHLRGSGCPKCKSSKGELDINRYLTNQNIEYYIEYKFEDLIYISNLKCDFYLPKLNLVIEYNGEQHYKPNDFFGGENGFQKTIERDKIKKQYCIDNGINFEIIRYDEDTEQRLKEIIFKYLNNR